MNVSGMGLLRFTIRPSRIATEAATPGDWTISRVFVEHRRKNKSRPPSQTRYRPPAQRSSSKATGRPDYGGDAERKQRKLDRSSDERHTHNGPNRDAPSLPDAAAQNEHGLGPWHELHTQHRDQESRIGRGARHQRGSFSIQKVNWHRTPGFSPRNLKVLRIGAVPPQGS
jgi:hypothetical protein